MNPEELRDKAQKLLDQGHPYSIVKDFVKSKINEWIKADNPDRDEIFKVMSIIGSDKPEHEKKHIIGREAPTLGVIFKTGGKTFAKVDGRWQEWNKDGSVSQIDSVWVENKYKEYKNGESNKDNS